MPSVPIIVFEFLTPLFTVLCHGGIPVVALGPLPLCAGRSEASVEGTEAVPDLGLFSRVRGPMGISHP